MNHMTVTTEHLRALLGSGPHSELVAVGGEIEIYVPTKKGSVSRVSRLSLASSWPNVYRPHPTTPTKVNYVLPQNR